MKAYTRVWRVTHQIQGRLRRFHDSRCMKVVMSALRTGRIYPLPQGGITGTHFC